jgi:hypothetical protein
MRRASSRTSRAVLGLALALSLAALLSPAATAQTRYATGQNVVPVFEGWERNPDGSFTMVFGYMNRNYDEELDVPVGAENSIEPALNNGSGADQGQPTHFYTRRQQFVFTVRVPKDWGKKDLVWTLTAHGKTEKAYASLLPFWELGPLVYQENRGGISEIGEVPEENHAPTISLASPGPATVGVGQPLALIANVTDDGRPTPRKRGAPAPVRRDSDGAVVTPTGTPGPGGTGPRRENPLTQALVRVEPGATLGVTWVVYRGSSEGVAFKPQRIGVENGKAESQVTFGKPGVYTLRAYADDTVLVAPVDVVVTVMK